MMIGLLLSLFFAQPTEVEVSGIQSPYCNVFGLMHEVQDPRKADFIVYEQDTESFAELIIYDQDNRLYANAPGHWHFVSKPNQARFRLYFTTDPDQAHFSVFFTDFESFAGCNQ
ncbi:MAG: DUF6150 family protein [Bacteroidota bacterium]